MSGESCATCAFHIKAHYSSGIVCRRRSPQIVPSTSGYPEQPCWPTVDPVDWCGEYREMDAKAEG